MAKVMTDVPKDYATNLDYRANLLSEASRYPGLQVALRDRCQNDSLWGGKPRFIYTWKHE